MRDLHIVVLSVRFRGADKWEHAASCLASEFMLANESYENFVQAVQNTPPPRGTKWHVQWFTVEIPDDADVEWASDMFDQFWPWFCDDGAITPAAEIRGER